MTMAQPCTATENRAQNRPVQMWITDLGQTGLQNTDERSVFENMALGQKGRKKGERKEEEIGPHYMQK